MNRKSQAAGVVLAWLGLFAAAPSAHAANASAALDQLATLSEQARYLPEQALVQLQRMDGLMRNAALAERAEYLYLLSQVQIDTGNKSASQASADSLLALARREHDDITLAKGMLAKSYVMAALDDTKQAHQLAWEAERIANTTNDRVLCARAALASSQAYSEEGNFPPALAKLQNAIAMVRQLDEPGLLLSSLNALAYLYGQLKEYDKGFDILREAFVIAEKMGAPGRMATLKETEYGLAVQSNQQERGLAALLASLDYERKAGAHVMAASTLVNLSDSYLRQHDYPRALVYGNQALDTARKIKLHASEATANINIGQAYLGMGKLGDGKRYFEAGLKWFEKTGDKPELQQVLLEYGGALERAGDMAGAVRAYHRERELSDELFETRRQKATLELRERYEAENRQGQIQLLQRENDVKSAELKNRRLEQRVWWLLAVMSALAAVVVGLMYRKVRHANALLQVKNQELKRQSSRDPLTGLYNRRHFQEFMRLHVMEPDKLQRATDKPGVDGVGALFLLDVDHFKHVNDTYGHAAGDAVLNVIADSLRDILRGTDMIVRWGGEEFLAFLPALPRQGLDEVTRRLLAGISSKSVEYQGKTISVTVSIGYAPFPQIPGAQLLSWERAVNLVDMALYLAKAHGRNRGYGVASFANFEQTSFEKIEQDLEQAWRAGFVDLSVVLGEVVERGPSLSAA